MLLHTERITLNREHQVSMTAMLWKENSSAANSFKRPSVLIFPGGGDVELSDREAENVAFPYLTAGFHAFVLYYSILEHRRWPNALDDYDQAITYIRSHSEEWNLLPDKIAVIGFSAGAHHAACAATMSENRPNAAILGYAPLEEGILSIAHPGEDFPAPVDHVDDCTPPCFLFSARDDRLVDVHNQVSFESSTPMAVTVLLQVQRRYWNSLFAAAESAGYRTALSGCRICSDLFPPAEYRNPPARHESMQIMKISFL